MNSTTGHAWSSGTQPQSSFHLNTNLNELAKLQRPLKTTLDSVVGVDNASWSWFALFYRHVKGVDDQL